MRQIEYNETAQRDILALSKPIRERILAFLEERVAPHPDPKRLAEPLSGKLLGLHRFRIGGYRAVCHISDRRLVILVLFVDHRSAVYKRRLPTGWDESETL